MTAQILVVEDDTHLRNMMGALLSRAGYQVTCASNGSQALALCARQSFDLVITDLYMPETDGIEVLVELAKRQTPPKLIAVSGGGSLNAQMGLELAALLGAAKTLAKPFAPEALLTMVSEMLGQKSGAVASAAR